MSLKNNNMKITKTLAIVAAVAIGLAAVVPSLTGTVHATAWN
jgi:hypothetical protein